VLAPDPVADILRHPIEGRLKAGPGAPETRPRISLTMRLDRGPRKRGRPKCSRRNRPDRTEINLLRCAGRNNSARAGGDAMAEGVSAAGRN
jgi:hypothetical protein